MIDLELLNVPYYHFYDLVFRCRYDFLVPAIYVIDFLDYVKAGIAYNAFSFKSADRKIAFFVKVLDAISLEAYDSEIIRRAIRYFYEDIFSLYKDIMNNKGTKLLQDGSVQVVLKPAFAGCTKALTSVFAVEQITPKSVFKSNATVFTRTLPHVIPLPSDKEVERQIDYIRIAYECSKYPDKIYEVMTDVL